LSSNCSFARHRLKFGLWRFCEAAAGFFARQALVDRMRNACATMRISIHTGFTQFGVNFDPTPLYIPLDAHPGVGGDEKRLAMPTIALVDDDRNILTSVSIALEGEGYRVQTYNDGMAALEGLKNNPPDMAIFDIKMPRMDGMELLRRLRQKSDLPVIFLTSKDEEIDELFGLKMGADDFIRKPFSQRLLVERVKAILRRANPKEAAAQKETEAKILERGHLRMDPERHACTWKDEPVTLTVTEFLILQALATRPGVVKSRNALMDAAYDDQVYVDDRTIDSHIKRLRKKFKQADDDFEMIETLYGVGYRFKEG